MQSRQLLQHGNPFIATNRDDCNINAYRMVETNLYRADPQFQVQTRGHSKLSLGSMPQPVVECDAKCVDVKMSFNKSLLDCAATHLSFMYVVVHFVLGHRVDHIMSCLSVDCRFVRIARLRACQHGVLMSVVVELWACAVVGVCSCRRVQLWACGLVGAWS